MTSEEPAPSQTSFPQERSSTFNDEVEELRNNASYRRLQTMARNRPFISLFLGSFLTASAIPLTLFFVFIFGTFATGVLVFSALQGGVVLLALLILCGCLVAPFALSTVFALVVFSVTRAIGRIIGPLQEQANANRSAAENRVGIWNNMATRVRALASSSNFLEHASGIPSNIDAATEEGNEGHTGLAQMAYRLHKNQDVNPQSQVPADAPGDSRSCGSVLRDCAERHLRHRTSSTHHKDLPPSPGRLPNFVPITHQFNDSDDEALPFIIQATLEADGESPHNRCVPSPTVELNFDFFAIPTRTGEALSTRLIEVQDNLGERIDANDVTEDIQEKPED